MGGDVLVVNPAAADVPCRLLLNTEQGQLVLGDRDEGVKRLRMDCGANVQILLKSLPMAFKSRDECIAVVKADTSSRLRAAVLGLLLRAFNTRTGDEKQRIVEVMIPEVACRHLVGASGDRIQLLREESGCNVNLAHGDVAGVAAQKRLRCAGKVEGLAEAVSRAHEVLVEFAAIGILNPRHFDLEEVRTGSRGGLPPSSKNSKLAIRLLVSKDETGWMIGKRGNKIHKLRELSLVSTRDSDSEIMCEGSESVVEIYGATLVKELCVLQLIVDDLGMMREPPSTTRLVVPTDLVRGLVARNELEMIQVHSGAPVRCDEKGPSWSVVELGGTERERIRAATALHEKLELLSDDPIAQPATCRPATLSSAPQVGLGDSPNLVN